MTFSYILVEKKDFVENGYVTVNVPLFKGTKICYKGNRLIVEDVIVPIEEEGC